LDVRKLFPWVYLVILATVLLLLSAFRPEWVGDQNSFLKNFVGSDLIATLGIVVSITLASIANIHLHLNRLAVEIDRKFTRTKRSLRRSALSLCWAFIAAIALSILKPLISAGPISSALANSFAIVILYFSAQILLDITRTTLRIPSPLDVPTAREQP
jgi:hypothetical protein